MSDLYMVQRKVEGVTETQDLATWQQQQQQQYLLAFGKLRGQCR